MIYYNTFHAPIECLSWPEMVWTKPEWINKKICINWQFHFNNLFIWNTSMRDRQKKSSEWKMRSFSFLAFSHVFYRYVRGCHWQTYEVILNFRLNLIDSIGECHSIVYYVCIVYIFISRAKFQSYWMQPFILHSVFLNFMRSLPCLFQTSRQMHSFKFILPSSLIPMYLIKFEWMFAQLIEVNAWVPCVCVFFFEKEKID